MIIIYNLKTTLTKIDYCQLAQKKNKILNNINKRIFLIYRLKFLKMI